MNDFVYLEWMDSGRFYVGVTH